MGILLRIPLFYKILIANAVIVVLGAVVGTVVTWQLEPGSSPIGFVVGLALGGVAITVLVNALILRLALTPLKLLKETAARVQSGDLDARAQRSALSDRELDTLTVTFNEMLDTLETYRQRLRDVTARALNAEEEERKRIARELHDDTAQTLAALLIRLRLLRTVGETTERERLVDELRDEVGNAIERVRRFARGLRPAALDELGLVPALESHIRNLGESVEPVIHLQADAIDHALPQQAELVLYRFVQEGLSNALRHADASTVVVSIRRAREEVSAMVRDDGRGFDLDALLTADRPGLGLFGMQERAAYVGGRIEIDTAPGRGTRLRAIIPLGTRDPVSAGSLTGAGESEDAGGTGSQE